MKEQTLSKRQASINLKSSLDASQEAREATPLEPEARKTPTLLFDPPADLTKMLYMVKVVGGFLNLYIHRKTLSTQKDPELEPYGLANLMMFHPEQIWLAVSQYVRDEYGVYLDAYRIDDLPVDAVFKAIFVFAEGIVKLDIVNMWTYYCKGFDEDLALHVMEDVARLTSLEKMMADDPSKGLAHFLGEVLKQTATRGVK